MIKIKLQGKISDIKRFIRMTKTDNKLVLINVSDIYNNKGSERFKHVYMDVAYKKEKGGKHNG